MNVRVVTAANAAYYELARDLCESIKANPGKYAPSLGLIDLGLTDEQRADLSSFDVKITEPRLDILPGRLKHTNSVSVLAMASRVFLPAHFPDDEVVIWIDSDAWVQSGWALDFLTEGALSSGFAVTPELHHGYDFLFTPALSDPVRKMHFLANKSFFGESAARNLALSPVINAGVFAGKVDASQWEQWAAMLSSCTRVGLDSFLEQAALTFSHLAGAIPAVRLPATCNWIVAHAFPHENANGVLIEPVPPYGELGIIHLTTLREKKAMIFGPDGRSRARALTWRSSPFQKRDGRLAACLSD